MIGYIRGILEDKTPTHVVIDTNGVGYMLHISLYTYERLPEKGQTTKLLAHLSIKEDAHTLFGFADEIERFLFRHLISVNGIGPNTARMMLSSSNPSDLQSAILSGNTSALRSIKGIGDKTAQRVIIDLKDKLGKGEEMFVISAKSHNKNLDEAFAALLHLGFSRQAIEKVFEKAISAEQKSLPVEELIKLALKNL